MVRKSRVGVHGGVSQAGNSSQRPQACVSKGHPRPTVLLEMSEGGQQWEAGQSSH